MRVWAGCVGTLICVVALGVKTIFIVCACVGGLCWDLVLCCGSWCKDYIYCVRVWAGCVGTLFCVVALGVKTIFIVCVSGRVVLGSCLVLWLLV